MANEQVKIAQIAVPLPLDGHFDYKVPAELIDKASIGKRVFVMFRNKKEVGFITGFSDKTDFDKALAVQEIIDDEPIISDKNMELARWMSETYICSMGEALNAMVPAVLKKGKTGMRAVKKDVKEEIELEAKLVLNSEQKMAVDEISRSVSAGKHDVFVLNGITGSGKTEVYLQVIDEALKKGLSSIVLVPEISLTPQTVGRFIARFGDMVAVAHSRLLGSSRFNDWKRIYTGEAKIVVGARSAIFSPVRNLGVIIIDEEHETSYKQDDAPRYHARDVAVKLGAISSCPVIFGSATPSLESYHAAKTGVYRLIELNKRIDDKPLPRIKIVDMRMEMATRKKIVMFSQLMIDSLERTVKAGQQALVFLNRRGFSTYINCKACGHVMKCKTCDAILVYHFEKKCLICHYCDARSKAPDICPNCLSAYMKYLGIGTEKVESELSRQLPVARIARMDSDTTAKRGSHDRILDDFRQHKIDVLVGTQMIAKGHDFPRVTMVGVVNTDVTLNLPDFRAGEKTFNLITQVAGRAGRGKDLGEVIIQTYAPGHYSILAASKHDYRRFYEDEISIRRSMRYPPFVTLVNITVRCLNDEKAHGHAVTIATAVRKDAPDIEVLGPAPNPISMVRGFYRWNVLLKGQDRSIMAKKLREVLKTVKKVTGVFVAVDVDPMSV